MIDGIPDQRKCDADLPEEAAAWAMVSLPLGPTGQSVAFHPDSCRKASAHLWAAGFRHHPELQTTWYNMPSSGSVFEQMNGTWKDEPPADLTDAENPVAALTSAMTPAQRASLRAALDAADEKEA